MTTEIYSLAYQQRKTLAFKLLCDYSKEDTDYFYYVNDDGKAILIWYYGNKTDVVTPKKIDGYDVIGIEATCYNYNTNIKSIVFSEGIEFIY